MRILDKSNTFSAKSLCVLASTMNQSDNSILPKEMNIQGNCTVINQVTKIDDVPVDENGHSRKFLSFRERGLSRSRNRAVENSTAEICVIADDDMYYVDDYQKRISGAYNKYPDADIIAFHVGNEDKASEKKIMKEGQIGFIRSMKLASWQITFKKSSLSKKGILFDEKFGTGTEDYMGEENILLFDCLRNKLKIYYVPIKIATLKKDTESTWFKGYDEKYFIVCGKKFHRMSATFSYLLAAQFALRKRNLYKNNIGIMQALSLMIKGIKADKKRRRIYYAGDFLSDNGPAVVNRQYEPYIKNDAYICRSNGKIVRILHFIVYAPRCDTILISSLSDFHLKIIRIAKRFHKKTFYLMHGYGKIENKLNGGLDDSSRQSIEDNLLLQSDRIICVSENFSKLLREERPDIATKITYVNNGVGATSSDLRPPLNHGRGFTVVSVGGGMPRKNNLEVCRAIETMDSKMNITFVVIGPKLLDGDEISQFKFVKYYEKLSHSEVQEWMHKADLYVQNSSFETFGLAVCEALSAGSELLIAKNVGAISVIDNLTEKNIINSPDDIDEIAKKISYFVKYRGGTQLRFAKASHWRDSFGRLMFEIGHSDNA